MRSGRAICFASILDFERFSVWGDNTKKKPIRQYLLFKMWPLFFLLAYMPFSPLWAEALFDSAMLVVLLFPVLYFLIFRPFVHQIDYLKKAEQTVRESEARFKQIFEGSPIGIAAYDNDGCLLKSNQAYLDIFGISDDTEIKCLNLFEFPNITDDIKAKIHTDNMARFEAAIDFEKAENLKCFKSEKLEKISLTCLITLNTVPAGSAKSYPVWRNLYVVKMRLLWLKST